MALTSTIRRFKIDISDVDRGVYEKIELRVAQHPSESSTYLLTRIIAYALNLKDGIEFSQGISSPDDAAIYVKDLTGKILKWIDIGNPSARRLHKASKAAEAVSIYTYKDPQVLLDEMKGQEIHRPERIKIYSLPSKFLTQLEGSLAKDNSWELLHTQGELSIAVKETTFQSELSSHSLV